MEFLILCHFIPQYYPNAHVDTWTHTYDVLTLTNNFLVVKYNDIYKTWYVRDGPVFYIFFVILLRKYANFFAKSFFDLLSDYFV